MASCQKLAPAPHQQPDPCSPDNASNVQRGQQLLDAHTPDEQAAITEAAAAPFVAMIKAHMAETGALQQERSDRVRHIFDEFERHHKDHVEAIRQTHAQEVAFLRAKIRELSYSCEWLAKRLNKKESRRPRTPKKTRDRIVQLRDELTEDGKQRSFTEIGRLLAHNGRGAKKADAVRKIYHKEKERLAEEGNGQPENI